MADKIELRHVSKVFGPRPGEILPLIQQGLHKDEILGQTGQTVGVRDVSLSIRTGEVFVVMGLSGSGKSTLVRMLNRLIEPTAGKILIDGEDIASMGREQIIALRRGRIAMVFQSFALMPHLNVLENTAFGLEIAGVGRGERHERAMEALGQVNLGSYAESYPDELSGGMRQRVGLARALATDPSILLMDEAFSALDPLIRREMQEDLLRLQEQHERTVVFISHDLDEAMRIGDRIAMMEGGSVTQTGTPREILENPAADYIRDFFRDVDVSRVYTAEQAAETDALVLRPDEPDAAPETVLQRLEARQQNFAYLVDDAERFAGVVSAEALRETGARDLDRALVPNPVVVRAGAALIDVLGLVARTAYPVPALDRRRRFRGAVSRSSLLRTLEKTA